MASMVLGDSTPESLTPSVNALLVSEANLTLKVPLPPKRYRTGSSLMFLSCCLLAFARDLKNQNINEEEVRRH
jgi:hypothetical protein